MLALRKPVPKKERRYAENGTNQCCDHPALWAKPFSFRLYRQCILHKQVLRYEIQEFTARILVLQRNIGLYGLRADLRCGCSAMLVMLVPSRKAVKANMICRHDLFFAGGPSFLSVGSRLCTDAIFSPLVARFAGASVSCGPHWPRRISTIPRPSDADHR